MSVPFDELNVKFVPVFGATFPVAAVANKTLQDVSLDSSAAVTDRAVVAVPVMLELKLEAPVTLRPETEAIPALPK